MWTSFQELRLPSQHRCNQVVCSLVSMPMFVSGRARIGLFALLMTSNVALCLWCHGDTLYFPCIIKNRGLCCAPRIFPAAARLGPPCCTRPKGTPKDGTPALGPVLGNLGWAGARGQHGMQAYIGVRRVSCCAQWMRWCKGDQMKSEHSILISLVKSRSGRLWKRQPR